MAACLWQCGKKAWYDQRASFKWHRKQMNRFIRRMAKLDPEEAWRKPYYRGYY